MREWELSGLRWGLTTLAISLLLLPQGHGQCSKTALYLAAMPGTSNKITSPNYPQNYPTKADCNWLIDSGGAGYKVGVVIHLLDTEKTMDPLTIYDGDSTGSKLLDSLSGSSSNLYYESSSKYMYIRFTSDMSVQKAGFWLQYFRVFDSRIGQLERMKCSPAQSPVRKTITTSFKMQEVLDNFPQKYSGNEYCHWIIDAGAGHFLNISVLMTDTEYGTGPGGLKIYDGYTTSAPLLAYIADVSQTADTPVIVGTSSQYVYMEYRRNSRGLYRGFLLSLNRIDTPPSQTVTYLPVERSTTTTTVKTTVVQPVTTTTRSATTTKLTSSSTDEDIDSGVILVTGKSTLHTDRTSQVKTDATDFVHTTTSSLPKAVSTSDLYDVETSEETEHARITRKLAACADTKNMEILTAKRDPQFFTSPNYPNNYNRLSTKMWLVLNPTETEIVHVEHTNFLVEASPGCLFDSVSFYKGECTSHQRLGKFCGNTMPTVNGNAGSHVLVVFKTDGLTEQSGFRLKYYISPDRKTESHIGKIIACLIGAVVFVILVYVLYVAAKKGKIPGINKSKRRKNSFSSSSSSSYDERCHLTRPEMLPLQQKNTDTVPLRQTQETNPEILPLQQKNLDNLPTEQTQQADNETEPFKLENGDNLLLEQTHVEHLPVQQQNTDNLPMQQTQLENVVPFIQGNTNNLPIQQTKPINQEINSCHQSNENSFQHTDQEPVQQEKIDNLLMQQAHLPI